MSLRRLCPWGGSRRHDGDRVDYYDFAQQHHDAWANQGAPEGQVTMEADVECITVPLSQSLVWSLSRWEPRLGIIRAARVAWILYGRLG